MSARYEFMCNNCLKVFTLYLTRLKKDDVISCPICNARNNCRSVNDNPEAREWEKANMKYYVNTNTLNKY